MRAKVALVGAVFWLFGWLWRELRPDRKPRSFTVRESSTGRVLIVKPTIDEAKDVARWNMGRGVIEIIDATNTVVLRLLPDPPTRS